MKESRWLILGLSAALVLVMMFSPGCTHEVIYTGQPQQTGVWVTGEGEVTAPPDLAIVNLGIETQEDTVSEAQAQAAKAMEKLMQALKDNGIAENDIQTQQYSIYPVRRWDDEKNEEQIIGYRVTNIVSVKIRELGETGTIIDAATSAGGDYIRVGGITFTIEHPERYLEEARTKALEDANKKAEQMARLTGVTLGKPTYISEGALYVPRIAKGVDELQLAPSATTPISPGEMKVTVSVQVAYAIA